MIGVIDYGSGNLLSVFHALDYLGAEPHICGDPGELAAMERLILPGVGAFRDCVGNLHSLGFWEPLQECVLGQGKPILGICLGMQVMARAGFEDGVHQGLGWFEAEVVRLTPADPALRIPQIGWNETACAPGHPVFRGLPPRPDFYFVHSYYMRCADPAQVVATCDYGGPVTAAVQRDNILGTQFHPEKSQDHGLKVLANFLAWEP